MNFMPFTNEINRLIGIVKDMGMVMVKSGEHGYQTMYKGDISDEKVISWKDVENNREAARELLSIAIDLLFDGDLE